MKTPEEIKKGLECCLFGQCGICPYSEEYGCDCSEHLRDDIRGYHNQLEAERDAAVSELVGTCQVCRWEGTAKCASCHFCTDAWNVHESNWEWRGGRRRNEDG